MDEPFLYELRILALKLMACFSENTPPGEFQRGARCRGGVRLAGTPPLGVGERRSTSCKLYKPQESHFSTNFSVNEQSINSNDVIDGLLCRQKLIFIT